LRISRSVRRLIPSTTSHIRRLNSENVIALGSASRPAQANTEKGYTSIKLRAVVTRKVVDVDATLLYLVVTISTVLAGLAYSEWRIRRFRARFATTALQTLQDAFLDESLVKAANGVEMRLLRPNARAEAFLKAVVPGLIDWAVKNVKIKLPPFELPENIDLKQVGASMLAQKALSGKKLKLEDAIPLGLGYLKDWAEKSGILETLAKVGGAKKKEEVVNPYLKEMMR